MKIVQINFYVGARENLIFCPRRYHPNSPPFVEALRIKKMYEKLCYFRFRRNNYNSFFLYCILFSDSEFLVQPSYCSLLCYALLQISFFFKLIYLFLFSSLYFPVQNRELREQSEGVYCCCQRRIKEVPLFLSGIRSAQLNSAGHPLFHHCFTETLVHKVQVRRTLQV